MKPNRFVLTGRTIICSLSLSLFLELSVASGFGASAQPNPLQIALLKWAPNLTTTFETGANPRGLAFDGIYIWIANVASNNVTKLRACDGTLQGTYAVGGQPYGVAF